jgi:hypothetical protein
MHEHLASLLVHALWAHDATVHCPVQLGDDVELQLRRIDEGGIDGDLCAIVNANGKQAVAVVWPTAEKLKTLKQLAEVGGAVLAIGLWGWAVMVQRALVQVR